MNYREAWANGEIEAGTLVDAIEDQAREIERLQLTCNDLDDQNDRIYAELAALKAQHEQDAQTIKVLQAMARQLKAQRGGEVLSDEELWSIRNQVAIHQVLRDDDSIKICVKHGRAIEQAVIARLNSSPVSAGEPVYQFQCREIGEGDWEPCDHSRYMYCQKSPEMDTRVVQVQALSAPSHGEQVRELPPFAQKVISKLKRFEECASDSDAGGVDIGRHWLDLLTQLGLLNRVQRSPGLWEISQRGEDVLAGTRENPEVCRGCGYPSDDPCPECATSPSAGSHKEQK